MQSSLALTQDMIIVLGLTGFIIAMLMFERIRADAASMVVLVILGFTGIISGQELFQGFSGNAVISVMASMILSTSLDRTGALNRLAGWILRRSKGVEQRLILISSAVAGGMSGFMQNPAVTSLFLPVTARLSSRTGLSLAQLLFPIAVAIILGGQLTMIGNSPLMMLNDLLNSANQNLPSGVATLHTLPMFQPLPIGLALMALGFVYFSFRKYLWFSHSMGSNVSPSTPEHYFANAYGIEGDVYELVITAESSLVGMSIGDAEAEMGAPLLLALHAGNESRMAPPADERLWVGSVIGVMGTHEVVETYAQGKHLKFSQRLAGIGRSVQPGAIRDLRSGHPHQLAIRRPHPGRSAPAQALWHQPAGHQPRRQDPAPEHPQSSNPFRRHPGVPLQLERPQPGEQRPRFRDHHRLPESRAAAAQTARCTWASSPAACCWPCPRLVSLPIALMGGAIAMVVSGVLNMDEAYEAISWKTIFTMACLIPLGIAMDSTGAANWLAQHSIEQLGDGVPDIVIQACVALFTTPADLGHRQCRRHRGDGADGHQHRPGGQRPADGLRVSGRIMRLEQFHQPFQPGHLDDRRSGRLPTRANSGRTDYRSPCFT